MFGPAFLVAPVIEKEAEQWDVYLPENQSGWYNFWTGKHFSGGQSIKTEASLSTIPLFVKAGSIIPMGKFMQHSNEKPADTLEIRIYTGTDGKFELYEDEGINYNYEKGAFAIIPFEWNEQKQTLVIGQRQGSFNGLLKTRIFNIVFVRESTGTGIDMGDTYITVDYNGENTMIRRK
jgi:alpha-D-xyloside xylohydrolase